MVAMGCGGEDANRPGQRPMSSVSGRFTADFDPFIVGNLLIILSLCREFRRGVVICRHPSSKVVDAPATASRCRDPSIGTKKEHRLCGRFRQLGARPGSEAARRSRTSNRQGSPGFEGSSRRRSRGFARPLCATGGSEPAIACSSGYVRGERGGGLRPM